MPLSRRQFIAGAGGVAGIHLLAPVVGRFGPAFGATSPDPALAARRRLVVIFLAGGNDGLNTVIPVGDVAGAARYSVYRKVRPGLGYEPAAVLSLDRPGDSAHQLGLNPKLDFVHGLYRQGRVAVVQGVDYPKHSYSHFTSQDVWESGEPGQAPDSGWLGRHLDRAGIGEAELRAVGIGQQLALTLRGRQRQGVGIANISSIRFVDGTTPVAEARHDALMRFASHPTSERLRATAGRVAGATVSLVRRLQSSKVPPTTGNRMADALVTARVMLEQDLGVELVFCAQGGYDTHANQKTNQERLLNELDSAIELFYTGMLNGQKVLEPMSAFLSDRTMLMTVSEFGRRVRENGSGNGAGTDHGAAAPVLLMGPPKSPLVAGMHGDHPNLGTTTLPADNLMMTTDLRSVYQSVLQNWLRDPEPLYKSNQPIPGLFT